MLLMVHGNPTWSFYWRELILGLRDRYRVVAVDHIGCGLSDKPPATEYSYRLAQRIADLRQFIEKARSAADYAGGPRLGRRDRRGAAVALPDRFARFVLMNTAAFRADAAPGRSASAICPSWARWPCKG